MARRTGDTAAPEGGVLRRTGEHEGAGGRQREAGEAQQRGVSAGLAAAARPADRLHLSRPRRGAGAAPAGRAVHRVPAEGATAAAGRLRVRGRLRRRRPRLHPRQPGLPRRRLRADRGPGGAERGTDGPGDGEATEGAVSRLRLRRGANRTMPRCVDCGAETPREEMYGPPDELRCRACVQQRFPTTNVPTRHRSTVLRRWPPVTTAVVVAAVALTLLFWSHAPLVRRWLVADPDRVWDGQLWRLGTSALLHANVIHLAFDVWFIWLFGKATEQWMGSPRFVGFFVATA